MKDCIGKELKFGDKVVCYVDNLVKEMVGDAE